MSEKVLFICGTLNQTTMMYKIAKQMGDVDCRFTPFYADGVLNFASKMGWLNYTVLGGKHQKDTLAFLDEHNLIIDYRGKENDYDLVVTCGDLVVPRNVRKKRLVLVQEGITEPEGVMFHLVKYAKLPRYLANTAATGLSDAYDAFCVASHGYRELFVRKGVRAQKIIVTGIPNFDDLQSNMVNDFPFHDYVLVITTPNRENFQWEDRSKFIQSCLDLAQGRNLIFKLHPAENHLRAQKEIQKLAPHALVFSQGNVNHMIANASIVITQRSTATFVALALGKEVYSDLDLDELKRLMPIQNGGTSAKRIAAICRHILHTPMTVLEQIRHGKITRPKWEYGHAY